MIIKLLICFSLFLICCNSSPEKEAASVETFSLDDFYSSNQVLDKKVEDIFNDLDPKERIAQMIVVSAGTTGKPTSTVEKLIRKKAIGGVLMLSGDKDQIIKLVHRFDSLSSQEEVLPLIYSSDAEPSLINRKIRGTQIVPKTVELKTTEICDSVTQIISKELISMGIKHNYAPVVDLSPNNEAITNRTFGNDSAEIVRLSEAFIKASHKKGIVATAKHFPGHGLVSGDTHNQLVTIDGEMKEVPNYIPLIKNGVISIMVGHIAVMNNDTYATDGLPASCSRRIVTDLLKNELDFKGIVITDAMNMGALRKIENASLKAVEAGCDMILMEPNEIKLLEDVYEKYMRNDDFKIQIDQSAKKILRLKICLNII
jgi:beta-N-acetylhexosaminidase